MELEGNGGMARKKPLGTPLTRCQGNLLNRHSHKYSGLANSKVLDIYATPEGSIAITKVKKDAKPNQVGLRVTQYRRA